MSLENEIGRLPAALHALLDAELAAGNAIAEFVTGFPAPPVGFCLLLEKPVSTLAEPADSGLRYEEWPNWQGYNGYTDAQGHFFVLNPPRVQAGPEYPVMRYDANGAAIPATQGQAAQSPPAGEAASAPRSEERLRSPDSAAESQPEPDLSQRFRQSMNLDYEKWREGIGYDLDALRGMDAAEKTGAEAMLLARGVHDWRDVEALALLDTDRARDALDAAMNSGDAGIRAAVARYAPERVSAGQQTASLVSALATAKSFEGLSETIDAIADFHPPAVVDALWRELENREGEVAVHYAALLHYIHGLSSMPFDWDHRPFFLSFHTGDREARRAAIAELRRRIDGKKG